MDRTNKVTKHDTWVFVRVDFIRFDMVSGIDQRYCLLYC